MPIKRKGSGTTIATMQARGGGPGVASEGWTEAPKEFTRRCTFMEIYGETGSGRTTLALTAPGPVGLAHTAEKIDGIVQPFTEEKVIRVVNFGGSFRGDWQAIADQASPVWENMKKAWFDGIDNWARTVIMDTDTEAWEMLRLARLGTANPQNPNPGIWGPINAEWRSIFKHYRGQERCSVVSIAQTKDEYKTKIIKGKEVSKSTGNRIRASQKEIGYMADVIVRTIKETNADGQSEFSAVIEKGWFNAHSEGMVLTGDEVRFPYIMGLVTGTDEEEWS